MPSSTCRRLRSQSKGRQQDQEIGGVAKTEQRGDRDSEPGVDSCRPIAPRAGKHQ